ncbi:MAG: protease [Candidatus Saccharibacteria bacterium]|nr:protease [Candidatus Saccharibacteria bacterium]
MYSEIARNKMKSWVIILLFVVFVGVLGWLFANYMNSPSLTIGVLFGAAAYALFMYFAGSKISLAVNGAKEIQKQDNPRLWRIVENLAITEGLPMPRVFIMDDPAPNAFATGRNPKNAAVCATSGILEIMNDTELEGVFAHEMGHVKNYDIRVSMIAAALAIVVSFIADMLLHMTWFRNSDEEDSSPLTIVFAIVGAILAPFIATLIQLAITRRREFLADATGALATRYPEGLASALEKIAAYGSATRKQNTATAHLFFANPLRGKGLMNLFSTHPPVEERIRRLREMGSHA